MAITRPYSRGYRTNTQGLGLKRYTNYARGKYYKVDPQKLVKEVKNIKKHLAIAYDKIHLSQQGISNISQDYLAINVLNYPNCAAIFGTSVSDYSSCNQWRHKWSQIDLLIKQANENANIDMTMYIVTVKDDANTVYDKTTGVLSMTPNLHYVINNASVNAGQAIINEKAFTIHKTKRFITGSNNVAPTGVLTKGNVRRFSYKLKMNALMKNPVGNMSALVASQDPSKQYYVIFFNNNTNIDVESPQVEYNIVHHLEVPL